MANSKTITYTFKAVADVKDVKENVAQIQKAIGQLKLPDELKNSFDRAFSEIEKQAEKAASIMESGIKTKGDAKNYTKSIETINRLLVQLQSNIGKISETDLKKSLTIDPEVLKKAQQAVHDIQEQLSKKIDVSGLQQVKDAAEKIKEVSKSGSIDKFVKAFSKGDFSGAEEALKGLERSISKFTEGSENQKRFIDGFEKLKQALQNLKSDSSIEDLVKQLKEAELNLDNLSTEELEKLKEIISKLAHQDMPNLIHTTQEFADGTQKSVEAQSELNSELDSFKSKITYFFGMNNAVQLFQRAVRAAYETVKDLDAVMTETAVVTNFTVGDMWSQLPEYTERANELGVSIHSAYESATLFYQQGLNNNEVMEVSTETLKMARIAGLDAATATDRMTNALRGFNMEINETNAKNIADVYSKLAAITASNVDEISTAMTKVASLANNANMDFETTAAFLSQIIETTRESAETAGTALKTVIARFSEVKKLYSQGELLGKDEEGEEIDVNKVSQALRSAGIDLNEFLTGTKGLDDIFIELASKWDSLEKAHQRYIATIAAGSRQQSRFIALMSDYKRTTELVAAANNAAGASQEQYGKTLESLDVKLTKLKNAWDSFLMGILDDSAIKVVIDALTKLLSVINEITGDNGIVKIALAFNGLLAGKAIFDKIFRDIGKTISQRSEELGIKAGKSFVKGVKQELDIKKEEISEDGAKKTEEESGLKIDTSEAQNEINKLNKTLQAVSLGMIAAGVGSQKLADFIGTTTKETQILNASLKGLGTGLSTVGSSLSIIVPLLNTFKITLSLTGGQIAGIVIALTACIALISTIIQLGKSNSIEGKLNRVQEQIETINQDITSIREEHSYLLELQDEIAKKYDTIQEKLKGASILSKEWTDYVKENNNLIMEASDKYSNLVVKRDSRGLLYIENLEESIKTANTTETVLKVAESLKQIEAIQLQKEAAVSNDLVAAFTPFFDNAKETQTSISSYKNQIIELAKLYANDKSAIEKYVEEKGNTIQFVRIDDNEEIFKKLSELGKTAQLLDSQENNQRLFIEDYFKEYLESQGLDSKYTRFFKFSNYEDKILNDTYEINSKNRSTLKEEYAIANGYSSAKEYEKEVKKITDDILKAYNVAKDLTLNLESATYKSFLNAANTSNLNTPFLKILEGQLGSEFSINDLTEIFKGETLGENWNNIIEKIKSYKDQAEDIDKVINEIAENYGDLKDEMDLESLRAYIVEQLIPSAISLSKNIDTLNTYEISIKEDVQNNLDEGTFTKLTKNLVKAYTTIGEKGASEITTIINSISAEAFDSTEDVNKFVEAISSIDWSTTDITKLTSKIEDLGIEADFIARQDVQNLINKIAAIGAAAAQVDFENFKSVISSITKIQFSTATSDNPDLTISSDDYNSWKKAGVIPKQFEDKLAFGYDKITYTGTKEDFLQLIAQIKTDYYQKEKENANINDNKTKAFNNAKNNYSGFDIFNTVKYYDKYVENNKDTPDNFFTEKSEAWNNSVIAAIEQFANIYLSNLEGDVSEAAEREEYSKTKSVAQKMAWFSRKNAEFNGQDSDLQDKINAEFEASERALEETRSIQDLLHVEKITREGRNTFLTTAEELGIDNEYIENLRASEVGSKEEEDAYKLLGELILEYQNAKSAGIDLSRLTILAAQEIQRRENNGEEISDKDTVNIYHDIKSRLQRELGYNDTSRYGNYSDNLFKAMQAFRESPQGQTEKINLTKALWQRFGVNVDSNKAAAMSVIFDSDEILDLADRIYKGEEAAYKEFADKMFTYITDPAHKLMKGVTDEQQEVFGEIFTMLATEGANLNQDSEEFVRKIQKLVDDKVIENLEVLQWLFSLAGYAVSLYEDSLGNVYLNGVTPITNTAPENFGSDVVKATKRAKEYGLDDDDDKKLKEVQLWQNPYDELYNINNEINNLIRQRTKAEREYQELLKKEKVTLNEIRDAYNKQLEDIDNLMKKYEAKQAEARNQLDSLDKRLYYKSDGTVSTYGDMDVYKYIELTSDGYLRIDWNAAAKEISDSDTGKALESLVNITNSLLREVESSTDAIYQLQDTREDIQQQAIDTYLSFEERVMDAYINSKKDEIDAIEKAAEGFNESNSKLISKIQKQINDQRQSRENEKTEQSIYDKESRLAYLRRDTSGINQLEILQLEKELEEEREKYGDDLVDQAIDKLKDETDLAAEQRASQIEIMRAQLDYDIETGALWEEVYALMRDAVDETGAFKSDSKLAELLKEQEGYYSMSIYAQQEYNRNLITEFNQAMAGLSQLNNRYSDLNGNQFPGSNMWTPRTTQTTNPTGGGGGGGGGTLPTPPTIQGTGQNQNVINKVIYSAQQLLEMGWTLWRSYSGSGFEIPDSIWNNSDPYMRYSYLAFVEALEDLTWSGTGQPNYSLVNPYAGEAGVLNNPYVLSKFRDYLNQYRQYLPLASFAEGGLVPFTGPAWLDGTYSNPEMVLSAKDTQNFISLRNILSDILSEGSLEDGFGNTYFDIDINAEIGSDYDVDQLAERIKQQITESASYRNINTMSFLR